MMDSRHQNFPCSLQNNSEGERRKWSIISLKFRHFAHTRHVDMILSRGSSESVMVIVSIHLVTDVGSRAFHRPHGSRIAMRSHTRTTKSKNKKLCNDECFRKRRSIEKEKGCRKIFELQPQGKGWPSPCSTLKGWPTQLLPGGWTVRRTALIGGMHPRTI
jgi:hypothetical protein